MEIIEKILQRNEFVKKPPVLVDVGASGELNKDWKEIAKYSICIAFDPDEREMSYAKKESSFYKNFYIYKTILTTEQSPTQKFYLTSNPFCSSTLEPDEKKLKDWSHNQFFKVNKTVQFHTKRISDILSELSINHIDWFKTDAQGTDLRLFKDIPENIRNKVLTADFEPGIMNAYKNEDKLWQLIEYFEDKNFWMSDITVKGVSRFREETRKKLNEENVNAISRTSKWSPGWAEVSYMNNLDGQNFDKRDLLLMWVLATIKKQYGFAIEIALKGCELFNDQIFIEMKEATLRQTSEKFNHIKKTDKILRLINKPKNIFKKLVKKNLGK
ncbi:MAG: hypothetical protein WCW87_03240 [Candidatus Paceibacterota bacterium]